VLCYEYKIKQTHSGDFMFVFVENEDEKFIYVLKRSSAKRFAFDDIRKIEDVNLPFEFDEQIVGKWKSIAYVENMDDFENKNYDKDLRLWLEDIEFFEDGKVVRKYFDCTWEDRWTKGKLLDQKKSVVSNYYFKTINGKQIMFLEWKMGNYVYGGMPATFYVFEKV